MKQLIFGLQSVIWAFEILICIAVLVVGLFITAFRPYSFSYIDEAPEVETYVPTRPSDGIDGITNTADSGDSLYVSSAAGIPIATPAR